MKLRRRFFTIVMPAAAVVAVTSGVAHALWLDGGSGSGSADAGNMLTVTVAAFIGGDSPSSTLYPGGTADVVLRVNNPNAFAVSVVSVTGSGTIAPDAGHAAGCTTTGVTFANQTGVAIAVAPGSSLVHLAGAATMSSSSSSGCQGATFSIPVTIEARTS
jgi:hypothetical protein